MAQMLKVSDKDSEAAIIKMLQQTITNTLQTSEKFGLSKE